MKKFVLTMMVVLFSNAFFAQSLLDKFDTLDGVTAINVNKKMFQMMASVKVDANDKETQQYLNLLKKLDNLKLYTTTNAKIAEDMKLISGKYAKNAGLEELVGVQESGKKIKTWVNAGPTDTQFKELLLFTEDVNQSNETVLMSLTGIFTLSEIAIIANKMKIPSGGNLSNAAKGK